MATTTFDNLITFSRGSNATVTGPNGLIQWAPNNLLTNSQDFEAAAWTKSDAFIVANQDIGGGTLGPELVSNPGPFTDTAGWGAFQGTVSVAGGDLVTTATVANDTRVAIQPATITGTWYRISVQVDATDAGSVIVGYNQSTGAVSFAQSNILATLSPGQSFTGYILATNTTLNLVFRSTALAIGQSFSIGSASVKQVTPAAATAPDGTQTADAVLISGATPIVRQTFTTSAAGVYTASVWLKSATNTNVTISLRPSGAGSPVSVVCAVTPTWQRFTVNLTAVTGVTNIQFWIEQFTQAILVWGAQLELGSTATTYNNTSVRNLLGFSEAFDNAAWTKTRASIVTGAQANPVNGLFNAQKLMEDTDTANDHRIQSGSLTLVVGAPYTASVYLKAAGRNFARLYALHVASTSFTVDLTTGAITFQSNSGGVTANAISVGSGWWRVSYTFTVTNASTSSLYLALASNSSGTVTGFGDGNSGVYIYGAMLSNSASLDPYVPTPGAAPSSTAYYAPRFDYDPVTLAPRGLLIEEQRANLLTYSEQFDNAAWSKTNTTVTANATASPDGTANADKLVEDTATSTHSTTSPTVSLTAGTAYTTTVYVKAAERSWIALQYDSGAFGTSPTSYFNIGTGTVGSTFNGATHSIRNVGNGWYRCSITATATVSTPSTARIYLAVGDNIASYTGNGTSGIFLYGAQLEAGAFATSYIPTVASTVTRSADVATITGSLFSQWYNQSEGTIIWTGNFPSFNLNRLVSIDAGVSARTADIFATSPNSISYFKTSDSQQIVINTATANALTNVALAVKANDYNGAVNSALGGSDTSTTGIATADRLSIGNYNSLNQLNGHIRSIRYVPVRAADFQLQALTELPLVPTLDVNFLNNLYEA